MATASADNYLERAGSRWWLWALVGLVAVAVLIVYGHAQRCNGVIKIQPPKSPLKTQGDPVEPLKELKTRSKNLEYGRIDAADVVGGRPCFVTSLIGQRGRKFGAAGYVNPAIGVEKDVLVIFVGSLGVTADVGTARKVEGMAVPVGFQGQAGADRGAP